MTRVFIVKRQVKTNLAVVFIVKVTVQLASLILAVIHNLCHWMRRKPRITFYFSKLQ
jgi:hypothetical protein